MLQQQVGPGRSQQISTVHLGPESREPVGSDANCLVDQVLSVCLCPWLQLEGREREASATGEEVRSLAVRCAAAESERARLSEVRGCCGGCG